MDKSSYKKTITFGLFCRLFCGPKGFIKLAFSCPFQTIFFAVDLSPFLKIQSEIKQDRPQTTSQTSGGGATAKDSVYTSPSLVNGCKGWGFGHIIRKIM
jgi:hypothetical protein